MRIGHIADFQHIMHQKSTKGLSLADVDGLPGRAQ